MLYFFCNRIKKLLRNFASLASIGRSAHYPPPKKGGQKWPKTPKNEIFEIKTARCYRQLIDLIYFACVQYSYFTGLKTMCMKSWYL